MEEAEIRTIAGFLLPIAVPIAGYLINERVYPFIDNAFAVFMLFMALGFLTGLAARRRWAIAYTGFIAIGWWVLRPLFFEPSGPSRTGETQQLMMYLVIVCAPITIGAAVGVEMATLEDEPRDVPSG